MVKLPPTERLGFGQILAPIRVQSVYKEKKWGPLEYIDDPSIPLHPGAKVLHYAQEIFEGMKVYKTKNKLNLFRPDANINRMGVSSEIMAMPKFPEPLFMEALFEITKRCQDWIPEEPGTLYLRPTMIASTPTLGVAPSSEYLFYIICSPVSGYFGGAKSDQPAVISVLATKDYVRAVRKGLGRAKTGANYAASLRAVNEAHQKGYNNVLFLDALKQTDIEELSGMNVFVVENNVLKTPPLGDTILAGVTRDSLIELGNQLGILVKEELLPLERILEGSQSGVVTEFFACGTGAAVTGIGKIGFLGRDYVIGHGQPGPITTQLYKALTDIQFGRTQPKTSDWIRSIQV